MMRKVAVIILAAGASRRLGEPKQLLQFRGRTLLRHAAETALQTKCRPVVVVIGVQALRMREELEALDVRVVENEKWEEGVASSIRAGLAAVGEVEGVIMMLCDQPFVTAEFLDRLAASERLAAAEYGGSVGVPAFFGREFLPELNALEGDQGAKAILLRNNAERIPCPEALVDIDTKTDAARIAQ
jgi:molybdenum cofactor cytidylyltransferase